MQSDHGDDVVSAQTDSVIIILNADLGLATDASVLPDSSGAYPDGIKAERVVLRSDSNRAGVLDLLLQNSVYVMPTRNDDLHRQMERNEVLLTAIRDRLRLLVDSSL